MVGERVYLPTADANIQSILCLNRNTGQTAWDTKVHAGQTDPGHHSNSSAASSTVACDGKRLYVNFLNDGAVYTSALGLDGKLLWQHKVCDFVTHQLGDEADASPAICGSRVYLRVATHGDRRQEHLYCLGNAAERGAP